MKPTQELLKKIFDYKNDGTLIWKTKTSNVANRINIGDIAGCVRNTDKCYLIKINGKNYKRSRLVWLYHHGYFSEIFIDHINQNPSDDRIENLREVTNQCNQRNRGNPKDNKSGVKGVVFYNNKKWCARIRIMNKDHHLGYYEDFDEAVLARLAIEQCLDWNLCDDSSPAYLYAKKHKLIKGKM